MKRLSLLKLINIFFMLTLTCALLFSCQQKKEEGEKIVFEQTVLFENDNWELSPDNKYHILEFTANITDTVSPHRIEVVLNYGPDDRRVDQINVNCSVTAPDGGKYAGANTAFVFVPQDDESDINKQLSQSSGPQTRLLYSKKYFDKTGDYRFKLVCNSPIADNYNIQSLTFRIVRLSE